MNYLPLIADIAITLFVAIYIIGIFWRPNRLTKKRVFKDTLRKSQINVWAMEMEQAKIQELKKEVTKEKADLERQIIETKEILAEEEEELKTMKAEKAPNWEKCKEQAEEVETTKKTITNLEAEFKKAGDAELLLSQKLGEITKQRSMEDIAFTAARKKLMEKLL